MRNRVSQVAYSGQNVLALEIAAEEAGYASNEWLTFRQAKELGLSVRGQHGVQIVRIVLKTFVDEETGKVRKVKVPKRYTVFNMDQTCVEEAA